VYFFERIDVVVDYQPGVCRVKDKDIPSCSPCS